MLLVRANKSTKIFVYGTLKRGECNEQIGEMFGLVYSHSAMLHEYKIRVFAGFSWNPSSNLRKGFPITTPLHIFALG